MIPEVSRFLNLYCISHNDIIWLSVESVIIFLIKMEQNQFVISLLNET